MGLILRPSAPFQGQVAFAPNTIVSPEFVGRFSDLSWASAGNTTPRGTERKS